MLTLFGGRVHDQLAASLIGYYSLKAGKAVYRKAATDEEKMTMNEKTYLGEFEELVLLTILKLAERAYGVSIREQLKEVTNRSISVGALYATLDRLERKGFVHSWLGEAISERGGRAKRFFKVEAAGKKALRDAEGARRRLVPKLEPALR